MRRTAILTTARLVARPIVAGDAAALADYHRRNRDHLAPWEPSRPEEFFTVAWWREEVTRLERAAATGATVSFVLGDRAAGIPPVLGRITLSNLVRGPFQAAHLGFSLDREAVGRGLMHEALSATIAYAFGPLGLHRIMANYMPANARSARLLRNLGFVPEGFARDYLRIAGRWEDHVLTSLVNPECQQLGTGIVPSR